MLEVIKVSTMHLEKGMYVSSLDRPWLETPFLLQGFRIRKDADIQRLRKYCQYVYIDRMKTDQYRAEALADGKARKRQSRKEIFNNRRLSNYQDISNWNTEYPQAKVAVAELSRGIDEIFEDVSRGGALDVVKLKKSIEPMIQSVTRNPDACIWLARLKQEDEYTYKHSLGASIWAVALGRHLGLPRSDLRSLAIGGLLFDIGKLRLDPELLHAQRQLTEEEFDTLRDHVRLGEEMVKESGIMNRDVLDMVAHHHERYDGSGYPKGLSGDEIPVFARIAAIVDCYDAITSHRGYARAIPPAIAIKMLYEWKDCDFQAELVEEFIQAVGIYPAGSLVELSSGEVALVIAEYRTRRLRPKVMVLLDVDKQPLMDNRIIDLYQQEQSGEEGQLEIVASLEPEAFGIDMMAIQL